MKRLIVGPFLGEFGIGIIDHVRWVYSLHADEIVVCCEKGTELLYPSATAFFTDYTNPIEDSNRVNHAFRLNGPHYLDQVQAIYDRMFDAFPEHELAEPQYGERAEAMKIKPPIFAEQALSGVDVAICPRYRQFHPEKNWGHWQGVVGAMRAEGIRVGIVGSESTCVPLEADEYAWRHPQGATAGTVDLLTNCGVFLGTDTGVSHLAAMMDIPMVVFGYWSRTNPNETHLMMLANKRECRVMLDGWNDPREVTTAVNDYLEESESVRLFADHLAVQSPTSLRR